MTGTVAEIRGILGFDDEGSQSKLASEIVKMWRRFHDNRATKRQEWKELRDYIFATDTTTTTNATLPWKNKTTVPKLCQIRDNLHANYMATLFPNRNWLKWEAQDIDGLDSDKAKSVTSYMENKLRQSNFFDIIGQALYDFIDYGNTFVTVDWTTENTIAQETGETISTYTGPRFTRWSPFDVTFNPTAPTFEESYKLTRTLMSFGELRAWAEKLPNQADWMMEAIEKVETRRYKVQRFRDAEIDKSDGYVADGFGSYSEYVRSGMVEVVTFEGDIYDLDTNELLTNHIITVVDADTVVRKEPNPSWLGKSSMVHTQWRKRPDNLYGMGPLDNLVGMQYRMDHLENIKADLFDLVAHPPFKIRGNVEEFEWGPLAEIYLGDDGDIDVLKIDTTALVADNEIAILMNHMEEFAGAPRQAAGARTPGEKTAFEVQTLEANANRMFQAKTQQFEIDVVEPLITRVLEAAKRNFDGQDTVAVFDDDFGFENFVKISKEDIQAKGRIVPVGARNFSERAQTIQNYQGMRSLVGNDPAVMNHISGKREAELLETGLNLEKFKLYTPNIRIQEQFESQQIAQGLQQQAGEELLTPTDNEI